MLRSFMGDTILDAAYILHWVPSKSVPHTLYELRTGASPGMENLSLWLFKIHSPSSIENWELEQRNVFSSNIMKAKRFNYERWTPWCRNDGMEKDWFCRNNFLSMVELKKNLKLHVLEEVFEHITPNARILIPFFYKKMTSIVICNLGPVCNCLRFVMYKCIW